MLMLASHLNQSRQHGCSHDRAAGRGGGDYNLGQLGGVALPQRGKRNKTDRCYDSAAVVRKWFAAEKVDTACVFH